MLDSTLRGSYVRASKLRRNAIRNRWRCEFGFRCNAGPMQTRKDSKDEADSNGDGHLRLTRHHCDSIFDSTPVYKKSFEVLQIRLTQYKTVLQCTKNEVRLIRRRCAR